MDGAGQCSALSSDRARLADAKEAQEERGRQALASYIQQRSVHVRHPHGRVELGGFLGAWNLALCLAATCDVRLRRTYLTHPAPCSRRLGRNPLATHHDRGCLRCSCCATQRRHRVPAIGGTDRAALAAASADAST